MPKTYNELYLDARRILRSHGVDAAQLEARELLCYASGKSREQFYRDLPLYPGDHVERRMNELNQAIEDLMQPYIHWVEDVLRVKCCYEKLLSDFLHIKHGFLTEADLAKQFAAYFKTESSAAMPHRKLNGPAPLTSCHEVFIPEKGTPFLCASFDFDRLGAFLYEDFFRGLAEHFIPKRCSNCGKWFLIDAGIYSDYCENPLAEDKTKTCRMVSARKKYDTKCKEDPIWNIYNKAYKAHYARIAKKKMTKAEFQNIFPTMRENCEIPILTLIMDEQTGRAGYITRLEAFVDLMRRRKLYKKKKEDAIVIAK